MSHYLPREAYERLLNALDEIPSGIGSDRRSEFVFALGEIADVWPDDIRQECEASVDHLTTTQPSKSMDCPISDSLTY